MKTILLATGLVAFSALGFSQTFVSTTPENRNAVLEEFTGIHCTYCPDGHKRAQQLHDANPNDVVLVNVHTGGYASPNSGEPDFRTSFGSALDNQAGTCGYPAGTIDRMEFSGLEQTDNNGNSCGATTAMGRGNWATAAGQVFALPSVLNVAGQSTLDLSTRTLTVVVEAYYTGNAVNTTNKLTVAVMENNVEGPQVGASLNPAQVLPNGNYNHMHMLRHFITGQWGEDVTPTTTGSFFTDTYEWVIPADLHGVPIKPGDLEVAVYVAEGHEDIISGSMTDMTVISPNAYDALPASINVPEIVCGNQLSPVVTIQNMGNEPMTSLTIQYSVNSGTTETYNWTGSLETAGMEDVTLPTITYSPLAQNTFWVATSAPNGETDQVGSNDNATKSFDQSKNSGTAVDIEVTTDNYGSETTWELLDPDGNTVVSGGPYTDGSSQTFTENVTGLANGCHSFVINDQYGDGMCCSYGAGSFTISSNGTTLYTGGEFGTSDERSFNVVGGIDGVNEIGTVSGMSIYPNPISGEARVEFNLAENASVILTVYNAIGEDVLQRDLGENSSGAHSMTFSSENLDAGIYMLSLSANGDQSTERVSIIK